MKKLIICILIISFFWQSFSQNFLDTLLIEAVIKEDTTAVIELLKKGANPNAIDQSTGLYPLAYAIFNNNLKIAQILMQYGASLKPESITPLEIAIEQKNDDFLDFLLKYNPDPNYSVYYPSLLSSAVSNSNYYALIKLLNYGAKPDSFSIYTALNLCDTLALHILLDYGFWQKGDFVNYAIKQNCLSAASLLLDYNFQLDTSEDIIDFILKNEDNPNKIDFVVKNGAVLTEKNFITALIFYRKKSFKYLQKLTNYKFNKPILGRISFMPISLGTSFYDWQFGGYLSFSEIRYNFSLKTGIFSRFGYKKIWLQQSEHFFWQIKQYQWKPFFVFSKDFYILKSYVSLGICTYYPINYYNITLNQKPTIKFSPTFSLFFTKRKINFRFDYFYWQHNYIPKSPHYFFFGIEIIFAMIR